MFKSLVAVSLVACASPPAPAAPTPHRDPEAPELVGAIEGVDLAAKPITVDLALHPATAVGASHVYLNLEHIVGSGPLGAYAVYLNVPDGAADLAKPFMAGTMPMFGVREASKGGGGAGVTYVLDVTRLVESFKASHTWNPDHLRVTFAPQGTASPDAKARLGRVSVFMSTR